MGLRKRLGMTRLPGINNTANFRDGHPVARVSLETLNKILSEPPPKLYVVSPMEIYKISPDGTKRRICGATRFKLPRFVPDDAVNPHGVTNPKAQYRCCLWAGYRTKHTGIGNCYRHNLDAIGKLTNDYHKGFLISSLGANSMSSKDAVTVKNFEQHVQRVKDNMKPEELWDIQRLLVELEALRQISKDQINAVGIDPDAIDQYLKIMKQSLDAQLVQVKRDKSLLEMHGIKQVIETFINGMVSIVERELSDSPDKAAAVLRAIENEVLLPISEFGYTELRRRQEAAGFAGKMKIIPAEYVEDSA